MRILFLLTLLSQPPPLLPIFRLIWVSFAIILEALIFFFCPIEADATCFFPWSPLPPPARSARTKASIPKELSFVLSKFLFNFLAKVSPFPVPIPRIPPFFLKGFYQFISLPPPPCAAQLPGAIFLALRWCKWSPPPLFWPTIRYFFLFLFSSFPVFFSWKHGGPIALIWLQPPLPGRIAVGFASFLRQPFYPMESPTLLLGPFFIATCYCTFFFLRAKDKLRRPKAQRLFFLLSICSTARELPPRASLYRNSLVSGTVFFASEHFQAPPLCYSSSVYLAETNFPLHWVL